MADDPQRVVLTLRLGEGVRVGASALGVEQLTAQGARVGGVQVATHGRSAVVVRDAQGEDAVALVEYDGLVRGRRQGRLVVLAHADLRVTRLKRGEW